MQVEKYRPFVWAKIVTLVRQQDPTQFDIRHKYTLIQRPDAGIVNMTWTVSTDNRYRVESTSISDAIEL